MHRDRQARLNAGENSDVRFPSKEELAENLEVKRLIGEGRTEEDAKGEVKLDVMFNGHGGLLKELIRQEDELLNINEKRRRAEQKRLNAKINRVDIDSEGGYNGGNTETVIYGEHYERIGNKKVLKSSAEYTDTNGYKYTTDGRRRITNIKGDLKLGEGIRNPYAQRTVGGADRLPTDDGGHLIGNQFNGSGHIDNLIPQNSKTNRSGGEYYKIEQDWANALKEGSSVNVDLKLNYSNNSARPSSIKVDYWIDGEKFTRKIKN